MALISSHLVREPCTHAPRPAHALAGRAAVCSSGAPLRLRRSLPCSARPLGARRDVRVLAADTEDADAELEKRLAAFKGTRDWKDVRSEREGKAKGGESGEKAVPSSAPLDEASWAGETVFFEGPPSRGDLAVNVLLGVTLLWLPLSLAAVGKALWVYYKVTDKRVAVKSTSPFASEEVCASYSQMKEVRAIGRGVGLWGDMVIVLNDGSKIEIRSIDKWQEIKKHIEDKIEEAKAVKEKSWPTSAGVGSKAVATD